MQGGRGGIKKGPQETSLEKMIASDGVERVPHVELDKDVPIASSSSVTTFYYSPDGMCSSLTTARDPDA